MCWPSIAGHGAALTCSLFSLWDSIGENEVLLCEWLSVGDSLWFSDRVLFLSLSWDLIWFRPVQALWMLPNSLWFHMCISLVVSRSRFLGVFHLHWIFLQTYSLLFFGVSLSPNGGAWIWWICSTQDMFQGLSLSAHCPDVGLCSFFTSTANRSLSNDDWERHWSMITRECC